MSIALETEWLGLAAFFVPPILYLLAGKAWGSKYDAYYEYLVSKSSVFFLSGMAKRVVFPLVWTIFFMATIPTSGFLYWFTVDPAVSGVFNYNLGLGFYWVGLLLLFSWSRVFFGMVQPTLAFFITLGIVAAETGFLAMCIIVGMVPGIVMTVLLLAWLVMATIWTGVAAFSVPAYVSARRMAAYAAGEPSSNDFDDDNGAAAMSAAAERRRREARTPLFADSLSLESKRK